MSCLNFVAGHQSYTFSNQLICQKYYIYAITETPPKLICLCMKQISTNISVDFQQIKYKAVHV